MINLFTTKKEISFTILLTHDHIRLVLKYIQYSNPRVKGYGSWYLLFPSGEVPIRPKEASHLIRMFNKKTSIFLTK